MKTKNTFLIILIVLFAASCAADKEASKVQKNTDSGTTSSDSLCTSLSAHAIAHDVSYADFITQFCGQNGLAMLRTVPYYYKGNGTPEIKAEAIANGNSSQMKLYASFASPTDPKSYFNMMRLQLDQPDRFDDIYEYDKNITYTRLASNGTATSYNYLNNKEDVLVKYDATTLFVEVLPNHIYILTSKLDKSYNLVQNFRGIQIINKTDDGSEIFSLADQTYDNRGDHDGMVAKAQRAFKDDLARSFRNSLKATQANSFFMQ